jgi:hypothetical protein
MLSVRPRNLVAVERFPWPADFPPGWESSQFCARLQHELRSRGTDTLVLDWTPLARTAADVVHLLYMAHRLTDDVVVFVSRTAETAPFFLAHRELILHDIFGMASDVPVLPWALFGSRMTGMPPQWEKSCAPDFVMRMCLHNALPRQQCAICLEDKLAVESPSQLPCIHFVCQACQPATFRALTTDEYLAVKRQPALRRGRIGITCPVCKHFFAKYALVPMTAENSNISGGLDHGLIEFT